MSLFSCSSDEKKWTHYDTNNSIIMTNGTICFPKDYYSRKGIDAGTALFSTPIIHRIELEFLNIS
jgi:hypothetical protein